MRNLVCTLLTAAIGLAWAPGACGQAPPLRIDQVRVGFPSERDTTRFRVGAWAPVFVDVTAGAERINQNEYVLVAESQDADDMEYQYAERRLLPTIAPNEPLRLLTYVRPGTGSSDVTVSVRSADGRTTLATAKVPRESYDALSAETPLCLTLGDKLLRFQTALTPKAPNKNVAEKDEDSAVESGAVSFVHADSVADLPSRWFGYAGVDVVVLPTASERFVQELAEDQTGKAQALAEWVRRGGTLVVSVSRNERFVTSLFDRFKLLDCKIGKPVTRPQIVLERPSSNRWAKAVAQARVEPNPGPASRVDLALLQPGPGVDVVIRQTGEDVREDKLPAVVQGPCGEGRVILLAFEVNQPPFTNWSGQESFWKALANATDLRPAVESAVLGGRSVRGGMMGFGQEQLELASRLQLALEQFDDVPVISFGWVALFILLYIVVIGPLDYFFLKKVVKRLEFTWFTFPAIVLAISAAAYFTAYYLKGNDLRVNKVDVVDIDLGGSQVSGTTWFTLFSPRLQNYTVGIEPAAPGWAPAGSSVLVDAMSKPEDQWGGMHTGSQSLFRRPYEYAADAAGLKGVPIQVWSTKAFTASWQVPLTPNQPPFEADITRIGGTDKLSGALTSSLPVPLQDVVLFYRGKVYRVDRLTPGVPFRIDPLNVGSAGGDLSVWHSEALSGGIAAAGTAGRGLRDQGAAPPLSLTMKSVLFHRPANDVNRTRNSGLHALDQDWRLGEEHHDELILFGRTAPRPGASRAEDVLRANVAPTNVWLSALPGSNQPRPELVGTLAQETYVRVYVPIGGGDRRR